MPDKDEPTQNDQPAPYPTAYIDSMLERTFGDAARHTPEELKVIEFVEKHLGESERTAFPQPHRHLVTRENGLWVVSVMSLESLRTPGLRAGALVVYVRPTSQGFAVERTGIKT